MIVIMEPHMLIIELMIDVGDAMGANVTNTMCEAVAPLIEKLTGGKTILLRILSNYSTKTNGNCSRQHLIKMRLVEKKSLMI